MTAHMLRPLEPDYTHALHAQACREAAQRGEVLEGAYVLAKRGLIVYCAQIVRPWTIPGGPECWVLDTLFPERTRLTVPCRNVIACPNPAACSCRPAGRAAGELSACEVRGPLAPLPLPNSGVLA
jgi:hypothetical protein